MADRMRGIPRLSIRQRPCHMWYKSAWRNTKQSAVKTRFDTVSTERSSLLRKVLCACSKYNEASAARRTVVKLKRDACKSRAPTTAGTSGANDLRKALRALLGTFALEQSGSTILTHDHAPGSCSSSRNPTNRSQGSRTRQRDRTCRWQFRLRHDRRALSLRLPLSILGCGTRSLACTDDEKHVLDAAGSLPRLPSSHGVRTWSARHS
jgi:hypothetical protein